MNLAVNARDAMPERRQADDLDRSSRRAPMRHMRSSRSPTPAVESPPEIVPRLFEPFFTTKAIGSGTGLGLAMVRDFVGVCGGLIEVGTDPTEGTSFTLLLPTTSAPAGAAAPTPSAETAGARSETILLIEDDALRAIARRVLTDAGYTVIEARYGSEALDLAADRPEIALVLSDVVMPGLSGPEVVPAPAGDASGDRPALHVRLCARVRRPDR